LGHGLGEFTAQYFRGWDGGSFHDSNELTQRRCEEKGNLPSIQSQPTIYTKRVKKKKKKKKKKKRKKRKKTRKKRRKRKKKKQRKKEEEEEEKKVRFTGWLLLT